MGNQDISLPVSYMLEAASSELIRASRHDVSIVLTGSNDSITSSSPWRRKVILISHVNYEETN